MADNEKDSKERLAKALNERLIRLAEQTHDRKSGTTSFKVSKEAIDAIRLRQTAIDKVFKTNADGDEKFVGARFTNVKSDLIEITHDKLENILTKHYEKRNLRIAWFNPASLGIGVALTLATADFKPNTFGLDAATWKAIFVLLFISSSIWLLASLIKLGFYWKESKIETLIDMLKAKSN